MLFSLSFKQRIAGTLARSPVLAEARRLWELNKSDYNFPLSKRQKAIVGIYIILADYASGIFPPTFANQQAAYDAEVAYHFALPGVASDAARMHDMQKPFFYDRTTKKYLGDYITLLDILLTLEIRPPKKLLELGCGSGWLSEFMALTGFDVLGTSISPTDIEDAIKRVESIRAKDLRADLNFRKAPMETVAETLGPDCLFDAAFVFEALHHVYDWRQSLESSYKCLKPGGWLIICNEPNLSHTFIAYRGGKLSNTHEIGISRAELLTHLNEVGFQTCRVMRNRFHCFVRPHWIAAQR